MEWFSPDGHYLASSKTVQDQLMSCGIDPCAPDEEMASGSVAPHLRYLSNREFDGVVGDAFRDIARTGQPWVHTYDHFNMVVCVQPVVVARGPMLIKGAAPDADDLSWPMEDLRTGATFAELVSKCGLTYGTTVPYSDELEWFVLSIDCTPRRIPLLDGGSAQIETEWGALQLTRRGGFIAVNSIPSDSTTHSPDH